MNCARLQQVLDAWHDGELDAATGSEIRQHLAACAACAALSRERDALQARLRSELPYFKASAGFARSIRHGIAAGAGAAGPTRRGPTWLQAGAAAAVIALASASAGYWLSRPAPDSSLAEQVVASHVASLAHGRPLADIASADRHVVKPWFQGKLDFAPVVRDLAPEGYALVGGRLDHVADRQAVAVVYRVRNHVINLFVWRAGVPLDEPIVLASARGYNLATWSAAGLRFAAVSDVDARDLDRFAQLVLAR